MAKSRRTQKQQIMRNYDVFLQEERAEEERLQREEDEFWAQQIEYERYLAEQEEKERVAVAEHERRNREYSSYGWEFLYIDPYFYE